MLWAFLLVLLLPFISSSSCPHFCVCRQNFSIVDCSDRGLFHIPRGNLGLAKTLILKNNRITSITRDDLVGLDSLTTLILSYNRLEKIEENAFDSTPALKRLSLAHNHLTSLQPLSSKDNSIISLDLRHNRLKFIHSQMIFTLPKLMQLDVSDNKLQSIPTQMPMMKNLRIFKLHNNPWNCDCRLNAVRIALQHHKRNGYNEPECYNPYLLRDQEIRTMDHLTCTTPVITSTSTDSEHKLLSCPDDVIDRTAVIWLHKSTELDFSTLASYEIYADDSLKVGLSENVTDISCASDYVLHSKRKTRQLPGKKPSFAFATTDRAFRLGQRVQLHCEVFGDPQPEMKWFKNGKPIRATSRHDFTHNNTVVTMFQFWEEDVAKYKCVASNIYGTIEQEMSVGLIPSLGPYITEGPHDQTVDVGQQVTFHCFSKGDPRPIQTWLFNGSPIPNIRGRFMVSPDTNQLTIHSVRKSDQGTYICAANNPVGHMATGAQLRVRGDVNDKINRLVNDTLIRKVVAQAINNVNRAVTNTEIVKKKMRPEELRRSARINMPQGVIDVIKAREIYEESLRMVNQHVENGLQMSIHELSPNISFEGVLAPEHIQTLMNASGCIGGSLRRDSCSDRCFHDKYRSYDGQCNNYNNPMYGVAQMPLLRLLPPIYENGFNTPVGWEDGKLYNGFPKPNPREVSRLLVSTRTITEHSQLTDIVMQWGQFIDHDLTFTATALSRHNFESGAICNKTCAKINPCFNIPLAPNDPKIINQPHPVLPCIEFERNAAVCGSGETSVIYDNVTYREQMNVITAFMDASQVYGSSEAHALELRDRYRDDGLLRYDITTEGGKEYLPFDRDTGMDCRVNETQKNPIRCFLAGDARINEQLGLTTLHTLFMREHNRIARQLKKINPQWKGETIYQESRKIVGAMMQHITFSQWLPAVFGESFYNKHFGQPYAYDSTVHPAISNAFATSAFRFGHTLISPIIRRLDRDFRPVPQGHLPLHKAFFNPANVFEGGGLDAVLRGFFASPLKKPQNTEIMNSELTEKLFDRFHQASLDLAVMNIQRGRDHALPPYVDYRELCGLSVPKTWSDMKEIVKNDTILTKLKSLYGHPGNIDLFIGSVIEEIPQGMLMGPLFACLISEQFKRTRVADRHWYENPSIFTRQQLKQLRKASLGKIICDNADDIDRVQTNVFKYVGNSRESFVSCDLHDKVDLTAWKSTSKGECSNNKNNFLSRRRRDLKRQDCIHEDLWRGDGESWTMANDTCSICHCRNGDVWCSTKDHCL